MEVRALRNEEREECIVLWRTVWPGDNDAYFRRYLYTDVEWLPYYTQAAVEDRRLVSIVHICKRVVACGDFRLTMGGIANVATLPQYRGRGYNTACLKCAIEIMEADAMDFSLLFTGISGYYARLGYAPLHRKRLRGTMRAGWSPRPTSYRVRPMVPNDLPEVYALYDEYNRTRPIAVQRSAAYWRDWIGLHPDTMPEPPLVAVDTGGRVAGYLRYQINFFQGHQINEDYAYIVEYGANSGTPQMEEEVATTLLDAAALNALASGKREMHLNIPLEPPLLSALNGILEESEENVTVSGMARLLHKDNLLRSLLLEWNQRWIACGRPTGSLAFETPYGQTQLNADGPHLRLNDIENRADAFSQSALFGLLFGMTTPRAITHDTAALSLLDALFPPQSGIYWSADGF